ncbi:MAG TPA: polyphosphate polymerase domain-containing protein [Acidimicrobiales bacterium]|nr:polyphosphate polymerase domain-containing protein [Acidimicrobiales bacterium]
MSSAPEVLVPLSLDEVLAVADLQTRIDRKYVVEPDVFARLVDALRAGLGVLEVGGVRSFRYESVYFDTPALDSYLGAAHDRRRRFKVRTRSYLDSGDCMLEVKTRGGRGETVKARTPYDIGRRCSIDAAGLEFVRTHASLPPEATLAPVLTTAYFRSTLVDLATGSRLTCDSGLECSPPAGASVSLGEEVLLETKSAGAPTAADRFLWRAGVRPAAVSKFCVGMAALDPSLPANKWNRILRRHFDRTQGGL